MSSEAQWNQVGSQKRWLHRLVTFVAWMAVAAILVIGYRVFVSEFFGKPYAASLARLAREEEGVRGLAVSLVRTEGDARPDDLSEIFSEWARNWLAQNYPAVELREGDIQPRRDTGGEVVGFRVWYVLVERETRLESRVCLDREGNTSDAPC